MTQIIDLAVRMSYESTHQKHGASRTGSSKPPGSPTKRMESSDSEGRLPRERPVVRPPPTRWERPPQGLSSRSNGERERQRDWPGD